MSMNNNIIPVSIALAQASYEWQEIIFPLIATLHNIHTTPFSCRLSKDQQHAKKIADSKLLTKLHLHATATYLLTYIEANHS